MHLLHNMPLMMNNKTTDRDVIDAATQAVDYVCGRMEILQVLIPTMLKLVIFDPKLFFFCIRYIFSFS